MLIHMRVPLIAAAAAFAFALLLPGTASAQNPPKSINLQFIAFPKHLEIEPLELLVGKETLEIATPGHEFSPPYKVPPLPNIVIGKTVQDKDGKPKFDIYGRAKGIAARDQIILLIRKGQKPEDGFVVMPMDARKAQFPGGSFLFINAATKKVGCELGDKKFALEPGKQTLVKPKADHDGPVCQATFYFEKVDGALKKFFDTRWSNDPAFRTMVFFYDSKGKVGIQPIMEMLPFDGPIGPPPGGNP